MAYENPKPVLFDEQAAKPPKRDKTLPEYTHKKNVYFALIDVLGFKQTFDRNRAKPDAKFSSSFIEVFKYFNLLMNGTKFSQSTDQWSSGQSSDNLFFYTTRADYLKVFIKLYSHFSLFGMSMDVFFRGGIAKGDLFVASPYEFYGDCVIKAYLLESDIAIYPRIAIDNSTYNDLKEEKDMEDYIVTGEPPERNYLNPFAEVLEDELQSIMKSSTAELFNVGKVEWRKICRNIQKNMERFEFDDKNYRKYTFLQSKYLDYQKNR